LEATATEKSEKDEEPRSMENGSSKGNESRKTIVRGEK